MKRGLPYALVLFLFLALIASWAFRSSALFYYTGEEAPFAQLAALTQLLSSHLRPWPVTQPYVPVAYAGVNPFGINTFLEQEVEPEKREQAVKMIAEAGFHWIRQEFPWEDIEIHGKGDFEDRRHKPYHSAWDKYDHIVELAERYGLELIVRLSNPPAWTRADGDARGTFAPPDNFEDFGDFVYTVVSRYRGRIRYYQIWNEPNIYPEWGEQPVNPEEYVELLKVAYTRAKEADPNVVIICGALASTIELGPRDLNDFIFLQRMYDAGAADYFDIMAMQGYGLWSGPYDRRMQPRVVNYSRVLFIRDIMVKNGDAHKPIWISEMNWNTVPEGLPAPYGRVTPEQQARYAVMAYQRAQEEWPWVGVVNFWFFKRPTDRWRKEGKPEYFFRMVEPDFTPLPVYYAMKDYIPTSRIMYPGYHQEDHWAIEYHGDWQRRQDNRAVLGGYLEARSNASFEFTFKGRDLYLVTTHGPGMGQLDMEVDGKQVKVKLDAPQEQWQTFITIAKGLPYQPHHLRVKVYASPKSPVIIDGFVVKR
ncbi:MAG TPA: hypothetical protein ENG33_02255 [Chloroflexi bacterium]|nr:hypothetical protein [Chloroflexota bacterium]